MYYQRDVPVFWHALGSIFASTSQGTLPIFQTEEGKYLASSLGDPLLKGLTEIANKKPRDPVAYLATYLANAAKNTPNLQDNNQQFIQNEKIVEEQNITEVYESEEIREIDSDQYEERETINQRQSTPQRQGTSTISITQQASSSNQPIEVITIPTSPEPMKSAFSPPNRDEHGQSALHFAASRPHQRNELFQFLEDEQINVAFRDEIYRTARDVSIQANISENTYEIDKWILHIAARGEMDKLVELLLEGYDHIIDIADEDGKSILEIAEQQNQPAVSSFLQSILTFEEKRERVHHAIRLSDLELLRELMQDNNGSGSGKLLAVSKNVYGRCSLHVAILCQQEEIVDFIVNSFPETLKIGDNLERTALHYAMGVEKVEILSNLLIKGGAKRVVKDLKGRQPSYYFMNKADILRLQEEEETF